MFRTTLIRLLFIATAATQGLGAAGDKVHVDRSRGGMVVSESGLASNIGRDVLIEGGNAVDAAVATAFALAVTWPEAGNIGGGGFMMVRPADGKDPVCIDYREVAPLSMNRTSFNKNDGRYSQKTVGVPGTVRGLAEAHARYGKLPWKRLVDPALKLAREGFQVDAALARSTNGILAIDSVRQESKYAELRRVYGKADGKAWQAGDRMVLPDLAKSLALIAEDPQAFYNGRLADLLVAEMQRGDGEISHRDLRSYKARVRPAMKGTYRGYTVVGAPPPSSGGTCIIEALNILENFDLSSRGRFDPRNVHLIAEASRRAFADRAKYLGDPEFTKVPSYLTSKAYAREVARTIDPAVATKSESIYPEIKLLPESEDTTHFSVIDRDGLAVSNTYTLEASWGSRVVVRGAGYLLNNEMGDFNWFPGETNRLGRIGTVANEVQPGKRMLSSQSPSFVERDGKLVLITGSPGGRTIVNTTLGVILNVTEFKMDVAAAVSAARQHHQWFPDRLDLERMDELPFSKAAGELKAMGHTLYRRSSQGSAHSIAIAADGTRIGAADFRRGGRAAFATQQLYEVWDFSNPADRELTQIESAGRMKARWSRAIAGTKTDGKDNLRIQRNAPEQPLDSYVSLPKQADGSTLVVQLKIAGARLAGRNRNEQVRLGFTHDQDKPRVTARMIFGRNEAGHLVVRGEALGGGSSIEEHLVAESNALASPLIAQLHFNAEDDWYEIFVRNASQAKPRTIGRGKVASDRLANFLRLSVLNDFAAEGEFALIDRICVWSQ